MSYGYDATVGSQLSAGLCKGAAQTGHVSFGRQDGPASVQINSALSAEAGVKLEAFLRELIAADAPVLDALVAKARAESERQQMAALLRYGDQRDANAQQNGRFPG